MRERKRERERERERVSDTDVTEKHPLAVSHRHPDVKPEPRYVP